MSDLKFRGYAIKDEKNWTNFEIRDFECVVPPVSLVSRG